MPAPPKARDTIMQLDVFREVLEKLRGVDAMAMAAGDLSKRSLLMRDGLPSDVTDRGTDRGWAAWATCWAR